MHRLRAARPTNIFLNIQIIFQKKPDVFSQIAISETNQFHYIHTPTTPKEPPC